MTRALVTQEVPELLLLLTHVPCPNIHRNEVRLIQAGMLDLHELQQLAESLSLLQEKNGNVCLGPEPGFRHHENIAPSLNQRPASTEVQAGGGEISYLASDHRSSEWVMSLLKSLI